LIIKRKKLSKEKKIKCVSHGLTVLCIKKCDRVYVSVLSAFVSVCVCVCALLAFLNVARYFCVIFGRQQRILKQIFYAIPPL